MKPELFLRRGVVGLAVAVTAVAFGCAGEFDEGDAPEEGAEAATSDALTTTFKFQNGVAPTRDYAGTADAVLRQVAPTTAGGSATTIDVDYGDGSPNTSQVGVLRFDVRAIAPGSKVSSASITLRVTNATSGSTVYALHPLLKPWNEAQVTWRSASSSAAWSAGGARSAPDRSSATIGTLLPKSTGKVTIALNASGVALVQRWVDTPSNNFGVVIDTANNADGIAFDSSEAATAADRPLLTVGVESSAPAPARSYHLHPYASNSVWNQPLADGVTYESPTASATVNFRTPKGNVNYRPDWSLGIWYPGAKDATYPIQSADGATTYGAWPIPKNWIVPGPHAPAQRDGWVVSVQPDGASTIEFYKLTPQYTSGKLSFFTVTRPPARSDLAGDGLALDTNGIATKASTWGMRASTFSLFAGAIRKHEILAADIPHAVHIAVPDSVLKSGPVWPARAQDSNAATAYTGLVPMGSRFALPPSTNVDAIGLSSPQGKALARALLRYGGFVGDRSSLNTLTAEMPVPSDADHAKYVAACEALNADWAKLTKLLVRVTGHTAALPGGPGKPRYSVTAPGAVVPAP